MIRLWHLHCDDQGHMDICLACYKDRLASILENATELKMYRVSGAEIYPAGHLSLPSKDPMDRTSAIMACGVKTLICGAVSGHVRKLLEEAGISIIPWVRGDVDSVLRAVSDDTLDSLTMPGCIMNCENGSKTGKNWGACPGGHGRRCKPKSGAPAPDATLNPTDPLSR